MRKIILAIWSLRTIFAVIVVVSPAKADPFTDLFSPDQGLRTKAVESLRADGPDSLLKVAALTDRTKPELDQALDSVSGQLYGSVSGLFWYTDIDLAKVAAKRAGKPILSLRLLGNLTDQLSCANSRFFRVLLYANRDISTYLRENFILHWQPVRSVPKLTVDYGDGRKIETTITGNSIHLVLDSDGSVLDALPGLYSPSGFKSWIANSNQLFKQVQILDLLARQALLKNYHNNGSILPTKLSSSYVGAGLGYGSGSSIWSAMETTATKFISEAVLLKDISLPLNPNFRYGAPAQFDDQSKAIIKAELKGIMSEQQIDLVIIRLGQLVAGDEQINRQRLAPAIHQALAADYTSVDSFVNWVYANVFVSPLGDKWAGLLPPNQYIGLPNNGAK